MRPVFLYAAGLSLALGAGVAPAAEGPTGAVIEIASYQDRGPLLHDLGVLAPPVNSDSSPQALSSAPSVINAEAIPELPTWAMMLLCVVGLGLAGFKKGRKDRLSPGLE
jgi:hypothetical protein